jgi:hypothetical protein
LAALLALLTLALSTSRLLLGHAREGNDSQEAGGNGFDFHGVSSK